MKNNNLFSWRFCLFSIRLLSHSWYCRGWQNLHCRIVSSRAFLKLFAPDMFDLTIQERFFSCLFTLNHTYTLCHFLIPRRARIDNHTAPFNRFRHSLRSLAFVLSSSYTLVIWTFFYVYIMYQSHSPRNDRAIKLLFSAVWAWRVLYAWNALCHLPAPWLAIKSCRRPERREDAAERPATILRVLSPSGSPRTPIGEHGRPRPVTYFASSSSRPQRSARRRRRPSRLMPNSNL